MEFTYRRASGEELRAEVHPEDLEALLGAAMRLGLLGRVLGLLGTPAVDDDEPLDADGPEGAVEAEVDGYGALDGFATLFPQFTNFLGSLAGAPRVA